LSPLISPGACSGGKFVVSRAGEAYDAQARGLNRKFRMMYSPLELAEYDKLFGNPASDKGGR
jgi:hypothetical protein